MHKHLLIAIGLIMFAAQVASASWCVTVTDNNCSDADWESQQYTTTEDSDSISIRYDVGSADCAVDIEIWYMEFNPPQLAQSWTDKCNCGVVVFQPNVNQNHILKFKVRCHVYPGYTGSPDPGTQLAGQAKFYSPGNHLSCKAQCIPD